MTTKEKVKRPKKMRDCFQCADQHYEEDMLEQLGNLVCEPCFHDTWSEAYGKDTE